MRNTRHSWLSAAHGAAWFQLNRHDDPDPADPPEPKDPADPPEPKDPESDPDPEGADKLGDAGKKALDKMKADKAAAKREAAAEKKRADELARKVQEFEDRDKTELDKATARAEAAAKRAEAATARAVKAEVKALAADFTDVDDALVNLNAKLADYADDAGEIDTDAIEADLADLLERKPHLRKQGKGPDPDPKKSPKPDPSQGPRKDPPPADWRKADRKDVEAELAKYGVRLRR